MRKLILSIVFLALGILLAPTALWGQTPATNEEIAIKLATTIKPPMPRNLPVPVLLPVSAWLNLEKETISFVFTENVGPLIIWIEDKGGKLCGHYKVDGAAATAAVVLPKLLKGEYTLNIMGEGEKPLCLPGYFSIPK